MTAATLVQVQYRGRADTQGINSTTFDNPTGGGNLPLNTGWTQPVDTLFRARYTIAETTGGSSMNNAFSLQFNMNGEGYVAVGATSAVQFATSAQYSNGTATSQVISTGTFVAGVGVSGAAATSAITLQSNRTEIEFALKVDGAQVANNDTFLLQVVNAAGVLSSYTATPTITISEAAGADFTAAPGVGAATTTGQAPAVTASATTGPTTAALTITGFAPTVLTGVLAERLAPNAVLAGGTNLQDSATNSPPTIMADIADEAGSPDTIWWTAVDPNADVDIRLGFPTPAGNLVGTQTINVLIRGTSLPSRDVRLDLYESGSPAPGSPTVYVTEAVNSVTGQIVALTFDATDLADVSGAGVELRLRATAA